MPAVIDSGPDLERLRRAIEELPVVGDMVHIRSAIVEEITDSTGDEALHATIFVDPPTGETWPFTTYMALRRAVTELAKAMGWRTWVYLDLATTDEVDQDIDTDGDEDVVRRVDAELTADASRDNDT